MKASKNSAVLLFFVSFYVFFLLPLAPLWAQGLDISPDTDLFAPSIRHEPPAEVIQMESPLELKAEVSDNVGVGEVSLFYRTAGEKDFSNMKMESIGEGRYSATVPKESISIPGFEYFIQAKDQAGNTVLRGFSFEPLTLAVSPPAREAVVLSTGKSLKKPWYKKWWVWTIALAVVGGAVAAGDSSRSGNDKPPATNQTGNATFSGPLP